MSFGACVLCRFFPHCFTGLGQRFLGFGQKAMAYIEELKQIAPAHPSQVCLLLDGYDMLVLHSADAILMKFAALNKRIVWSAMSICWPQFSQKVSLLCFLAFHLLLAHFSYPFFVFFLLAIVFHFQQICYSDAQKAEQYPYLCAGVTPFFSLLTAHQAQISLICALLSFLFFVLSVFVFFS